MDKKLYVNRIKKGLSSTLSNPNIDEMQMYIAIEQALRELYPIDYEVNAKKINTIIDIFWEKDNEYDVEIDKLQIQVQDIWKDKIKDAEKIGSNILEQL